MEKAVWMIVNSNLVLRHMVGEITADRILRKIDRKRLKKNKIIDSQKKVANLPIFLN